MTDGQDCDVVSFGCRLNAYEAEVIRGHARQAGLSRTVVVNSCAVTAEAVRQTRQTIRRLRKERPSARIVVTGCAAQIDPLSFARMPEVDHVIGNGEKMAAASYAALASGQSQRIHVDDIMAVHETAGHLVDGIAGRARAFVQIQNGCDHRCTFCIIPYGRGNSRSVPVAAVIDQIRHLTERGVPEAVLTGVDLTAYGRDLNAELSLGRLIRTILDEVPGLRRLRLSSLDAIEVDDELFRIVSDEPRVMPHLHLSLQAGSDLVLKRMKRRHTRADAVAFCTRLKAARPDIALGADFIVGFPTESDAMFDDTLSLVGDCDLTWLHVFPFSPRAGTPAARMPQVPREVIRARAQRLREAGAERVRLHLARHVGTTASAMMEEAERGRLDDYSPVRLTTAGAAAGSTLSVVIGGHDGRTLLARAAA